MILIYCTFPDAQMAEDISKTLVSEKLIACANIFPAIKSIYPWEGKIEVQSEIVALFKSQSDLYIKIENRIKELHPYEIPCVLQLNVEQGNSDYLKWVKSITG